MVTCEFSIVAIPNRGPTLDKGLPPIENAVAGFFFFFQQPHITIGLGGIQGTEKLNRTV